MWSFLRFFSDRTVRLRRNEINSSQSRHQSSISNLHEAGSKAHEVILKKYENDSNHMKFT